MSKPLQVLIIGGVACGPKTASRLKRLDPNAEITMIERGPLVSYGACGLPYYVEGMFSDIDELIKTPVGVPRNAGFFHKVKGFQTFTRMEATHILREKKLVRVRNLDNGAVLEMPYDKLVIATGSSPIRPPIPGMELENIWWMRHPDDAQSLVESIQKRGLKKAVIIGAGYIGVEMAEALATRGLHVTMVEMFDQIMPQFLDEEMAMLAAKALTQQGVQLALGQRVVAVEGNGKVSAVRTAKESIPADLVLIGVGVRPNDELARDAGLECSPRGGILVNATCQTSDPDIYAGGDCVLNHHVDPLMRSPLFVPLGSTSNKHGRVIADHIAGVSSPFPGICGTGICRVFDTTVGRTGFTEKQARELDPEIETVIWAGPDLPHYVPDAKPLVMKLVASKRHRKLLGVQLVAKGNGAKRLDVAASALFFGATVDQLGNLDLAYAPPYSPPIDPLATAAHVMVNKLNGIGRSISPIEARKRIERGDDVVLLDVRTPDEFQAVRLPYEGVLHIPLGALREKAAELPKDKDILAFCKISMRGYEAQRILGGMGFERVWFIEGGIVGWPFDLWTGN
jgi:NADPH-dependent 2,4-dienoyl-CoA reductase/sulfur reductase-like enzyme/rhodanese-related sulfurtransferase